MCLAGGRLGPIDRNVIADWRPGHKVTLSQPAPARALRNDDLATACLVEPAPPPSGLCEEG